MDAPEADGQDADARVQQRVEALVAARTAKLTAELSLERDARTRAEQLRAGVARHASRLELLTQLILDFSTIRSLSELLELAAFAVDQLFPAAARSSVALLEDGGARMRLYQVVGDDEVLPAGSLVSVPKDMSQLDGAARVRLGAGVRPSSVEMQALAVAGLRDFITAPLQSKGRVIGTLNIGAATSDAFSDDDVDLLAHVGVAMAVNIEFARVVERLDGAISSQHKTNLALARELRERERAQQVARERERQLAEQHAELLAMSTPLLPIGEAVLVLPLVGVLSRERTTRLAEVALAGARERGARVMILDVTGVEVVDAEAAGALARVAAALQLLGCRAVLTGIRPQLARALVELGSGLGGLEVRATLQSAVRAVLGA
ncbi:MAG: GAF domain-containing protein [Myxococcales bacterium]|nr:GAF domain-containing protein [Myxococcales bacterium]